VDKKPFRKLLIDPLQRRVDPPIYPAPLLKTAFRRIGLVKSLIHSDTEAAGQYQTRRDRRFTGFIDQAGLSVDLRHDTSTLPHVQAGKGMSEWHLPISANDVRPTNAQSQAQAQR
jgi:hypothetical protein